MLHLELNGTAATSSGDEMPKTSGPSKIICRRRRKKTYYNKCTGFKIPGTKSNDRPAYERPGTGSTEVNKPKTVKPSSNTNTSTRPNKNYNK